MERNNTKDDTGSFSDGKSGSGKRGSMEESTDEVLAHEMYREHILDLFSHPHNFGKLQHPTHRCHEFNPLCGDEVTVEVEAKQGKVSSIKFNGKGCAISIASASLVTDRAKGMPLDKAMKLTTEDVLGMLQIPIGPVRLKCALLPLEALQKAINVGKIHQRPGQGV